MNTSLSERLNNPKRLAEKQSQKTLIFIARIMTGILILVGVALLIIGIMFIVIQVKTSNAKNELKKVKSRLCLHTVKGEFSVNGLEKIATSPRGEFVILHKDGMTIISRSGYSSISYHTHLENFLISDRNIYGTKNYKGNKVFYSLRLNSDNSRAEQLPDEYTYTILDSKNKPGKFLIVGTSTVDEKQSGIVQYIDAKFVVHKVPNFEIISIVYVYAGTYYLIGNDLTGKTKRAGIIKYFENVKTEPVKIISDSGDITDGFASLPVIFAWKTVNKKTTMYSYSITDEKSSSKILSFPIFATDRCQISDQGRILCAHNEGNNTKLVSLGKSLDEKERPPMLFKEETLMHFSRSRMYTNILLTKKGTAEPMDSYGRYEISDKFEKIYSENFEAQGKIIDFFGASDHRELGIVLHYASNPSKYSLGKFGEQVYFDDINRECMNL